MLSYTEYTESIFGVYRMVSKWKCPFSWMERHPIRLFSLNSRNQVSHLACCSVTFQPGSLSDGLVPWNACWEGSFSLYCGLSSWIDITQCTSLSLSQHELHNLGKTFVIWIADNLASAACSEFRSWILERIFSLLVCIGSLRSAIKPHQ